MTFPEKLVSDGHCRELITTLGRFDLPLHCSKITAGDPHHVSGLAISAITRRSSAIHWNFDTVETLAGLSEILLELADHAGFSQRPNGRGRPIIIVSGPTDTLRIFLNMLVTERLRGWMAKPPFHAEVEPVTPIEEESSEPWQAIMYGCGANATSARGLL